MTTQTQDALWLDAEQQRAWRAYLVGTTLLMDRLDRDLRAQHDLSLPEYEVLVRLSECAGHRLRMASLADSLSHSRSRVTHTVTRLERAGLVERVSCTSDGRGVEAVLTEQGFALLAGRRTDARARRPRVPRRPRRRPPTSRPSAACSTPSPTGSSTPTPRSTSADLTCWRP